MREIQIVYVFRLVMDKILSLIGEKTDPRIGGGDSFADRLSCRYSFFQFCDGNHHSPRLRLPRVIITKEKKIIALNFTDFRRNKRFFVVRYTATLLIVFAVLLTSKQYYGQPIDCWCPAHFTDSHVSFTNAVCWVSTF